MKFYKLASRYAALPRDVEYPCVGLRYDTWDDFTFRTTFHFEYYTEPGKAEFSEVVKILKRGEKVTDIPKTFEALDDTYCSLGQSVEYYEQLLGLGVEIYGEALTALNDVAYNREIRAAFEEEEGFTKSLTRYNSETYVLAKLENTQEAPDSQETVNVKSSEDVYDFEIEEQKTILATHRRLLRILLQQHAVFGNLYAPPHLIYDIQERRAAIRRIKTVLRGWGVEVEDLSDDEPPGELPDEKTKSPTRNTVFISYSHNDRRWLERLQVHLKPLERLGSITRWDDTLIAPGSNWKEEIKAAIESAKVAILLVSADFLASEFIAHNELPPLLAAAKNDGAVILPVIINYCRFQQTDLAQFQAVNSPTDPLFEMRGPRREKTLLRVTEAVEAALRSSS